MEYLSLAASMFIREHLAYRERENITHMRQQSSDEDTLLSIDMLLWSALTTKEQMRRFELLRLAFFVLKLRKLEQRKQEVVSLPSEEHAALHAEHEFRCNLLRHVIFHQMITLSSLDAHEQAMQLIASCRV